MELQLEFGKHAGKKLKDVPTDYLFWLLTDSLAKIQDDGKYALFKAVKAELQNRGKAGIGFDFLAGRKKPREVAYVLSWSGSTNLVSVQASLEEAVKIVEDMMSIQEGPNIQTDAVVIWKVFSEEEQEATGGTKEVAWVCAAPQFIRAYGGVQGKLPGHSKTLFFEERVYEPAAA